MTQSAPTPGYGLRRLAKVVLPLCVLLLALLLAQHYVSRVRSDGSDSGAGRVSSEDRRAPPPVLRGKLDPPIDLEVRVRAMGGSPPDDLFGLLVAPAALRSERGSPDEIEPRVDRDEGRLVFGGVGYRVWTLIVAAPGYASHVGEVSLPDTDETSMEMEVVLSPWGTVIGVVSGPDDEPVPGARVKLGGAAVEDLNPKLYHPADRPLYSALQRVVTDGGGRFELMGLHPGRELRIAVSHPDYANGSADVETPAKGEVEELALRLEAPSGLRGRVDLQAFDGTAESTIVQLFHVEENVSAQERYLRPEADGRFRFRKVAPGGKSLCVVSRSPGNIRVLAFEVFVEPSREVDVGLLQPGAGVSVDILAEVEAPYPAAAEVRCTWAVWPSDGALTRLSPMTVDLLCPVGERILIHGMPDGVLTATFDLVSGEKKESVPTHKGEALRIEQDKRGSPWHVVLERLGEPVERAHTTLRATPPPTVLPNDFSCRSLLLADDRVLGGMAWPSPRGTYKWSGSMRTSPDHEVEAYLFSDGWVSGPIALGRVRPDDNKRAEFREWREAPVLVVAVVDDEGAPVPGAEVRVYLGSLGDQGELASPPYIAAAEADEEGMVRVTVLPSRSFAIKAWADGYSRPVSVDGVASSGVGEEGVPVTLTLTRVQ